MINGRLTIRLVQFITQDRYYIGCWRLCAISQQDFVIPDCLPDIWNCWLAAGYRPIWKDVMGVGRIP